MKTTLAAALFSFALPATATAQGCLTSLFASDNGGSADWAIFMDATVSSSATVTSLEINTSSSAGNSGGVEVYTRSGTYSGSEQTMAGWTLVATDDGTAVSAGLDNPTLVPLASAFTINPGGTTGIAIVYRGFSLRYTDGDGTNQTYTDGNLTLTMGSSCSDPFVGGLVFEPRVFNGSFCTGTGGLGSNYCMANANSIGLMGSIRAVGSASAAANDVTLEASNLPIQSFGFFITSMTQGFVPNPAGSEGNLCLGGAIGRYVGPGQIQQSDLSGVFSLTIDLTMTPQPNGIVSILGGETWNFQAWHRDSVGGMATSNFTDGLQIDFF